MTSGVTLYAVLPTLLLAGSNSNGGGSEALTMTILLTLLVIVLVFFVLLVPESDQRKVGEALSKMRRYVVAGSKERDVALDHDFDGIRELDNRVPPWFTYLFLGTIVFAAIYMLDYHVFGTSKLMHAEYEEEMAAAELRRSLLLANEGTIDENALAALTDAEALKRGSEQYQKWCVSCHGNYGQGLVGPNLTDQYWIHGGGIKNVYGIIKKGVPAKGMISWQLVLSPKQIQETASYVLSLQGTNPVGAKKPEGTPYVHQDSTAAQL